jgi:hypothetical protein
VESFQYDVFVSYRRTEPDRGWVHGQLVPRLRADGLKVFLDDDDFRLGAPLVLEMARAVQASRYTLAVLTPEYLRSNYTELETVLAEHLGLERTERRLLAVMREAAQPRLGMRARLWLDMTDDAEFESAASRLCGQLRRSPDA